MGREPSAGDTRWSRRCSTTKPISSATARRSTCLPAHALPELAKRARRHEAPAHLVGRLLDRAGSLFAGDAVRRGPGALGTAGRSTSSAPTSAKRVVDRARERHLQPVRGPARPRHHPDDPLVRGMRRRLARGRAAAPAGPLPGPQPARAAAASRASSTSSCAATSCSTSTPRRRALAFDRLAVGDGAGRLADARRRRDGDRPDQATGRRPRGARPLPPRRRGDADRPTAASRRVA